MRQITLKHSRMQAITFGNEFQQHRIFFPLHTHSKAGNVPIKYRKGVPTLSLVRPDSLPQGQIRTKEKYRTLNGLPALMAYASGISERRIYHENNYSLTYPQIISRVFNCLYYKCLWYILGDSSSNNLPVNLITTTMSGPHSVLVFLIISGKNPHNFQKQKFEK